ncbi:MAG TPA: PhnD/SsuA/transferrin family substrate-binding protein [Stellaceae bacterium]|nr:PhnD/SsuA/transferrin family substrate-binding protein [Stellaceae bacterium]
MYDLPELQGANDRLWRATADRLVDHNVEGVPLTLTRDRPLEELWRDPQLLLAQSCGYPLVTSLRGAVKIVATPRYRAPGCVGSFYRSAIVVAVTNPVEGLAELCGSRCAANDPISNSGTNLLRAAIAPLAGGRPFFRSVRWSRSHRESLALVAGGEADVAAIDCVTFEHLRKAELDLVAAVRVVAWSEASPGLPLITSVATDLPTFESLRAALADIVNDGSVAPALDALLIEGFDPLALDAYESVLELERRSAALGYPELA